MTVSNNLGSLSQSVSDAYAANNGAQMEMSVFALKKSQQAESAVVGQLLESLPVLRYSPGGQTTSASLPGQQLDLLA